MAQKVKNLSAIQETWVQSLGWEDPLEKGMVTHSSILTWRIPWALPGVAKSRTQLTDIPFHFCFESMISLDIFSSQYKLRSQKITTVRYTLMS